MSEPTNKELLEGLGVEVETKTKSSLTPRQERIIAGFEDIQRIVEEHGHAPSHGEDKDIFERIYAAPWPDKTAKWMHGITQGTRPPTLLDASMCQQC